MAWHHVIPFSLLREVWNRLVDRHIATELVEARVAIRQYLLLSDRNQPNLDALIDRMRAVNTDQRRAGHHRLEPLDVPEAHQLATLAVWPAWNIVEGPMARSDNPPEGCLDYFTSGLTAEEVARMRVIESLFGSYQSLVGAGPAPGPGSLRALIEAVSAARPMLGAAEPIRYRPEMWVDDGAGLRRKRRGGEP